MKHLQIAFAGRASAGRLRRASLALGLGLLASGWSGLLAAQGFPSRPIKIIVPYASGGGVDIVARSLAEGITKEFGHTVVVENKTGAASNVGSAFVAKSEPDGHTLLMASNANAVNVSLYKSMPYDPVRELTPVTLVGRVPMVLLTGPNSPFKTAGDAVAAARAKPGSINFGSGGAGTSEHLTSELFKRKTGITAVHVPYRGGAAVYPDLVSGQIHLFFNNQLQAMPFITSGQVRVLGISSATRSKQLPDVPTLIEQGAPDLVTGAWWGVMGPGNLSPEVVAVLSQMINRVLLTPAVSGRLESLGAERAGGPQTAFRDFFSREMAVWSEIIKAEKIVVE